MAIVLTDKDIQRLLAERKPLPEDYRSRMVVKPKRGHKENELEVKGADGSEFALVLRQAASNPLDFSVILYYRFPKSSRVFRLRRYNGKSHEHTNHLEQETFYDFHMHQATERYQDSGHREDAYAQPANAYADFSGAIDCMLKDCGFEVPPDTQGRLFEPLR